MQKLTDSQLRFIDTYLLKNKVKYWDVRVELTDHIASLVEQKFAEGFSFEDAMFTVHEGFGNNVNKPRLNKSNTAWITTKSIYQSNEGFQKLIQEKTITLKKKYSRLFWEEIKKLFINPRFIVLIVVLMILAKLFYTDLNSKQLQLCNLLLLLVSFLMIFPKVLKKQVKKSLAINTAFAFYFAMAVGIVNLLQVLNIFDEFYTAYGKQICLSSFFILLTLMISFYFVFRNIIREQNSYYKFSIQ